MRGVRLTGTEVLCLHVYTCAGVTEPGGDGVMSEVSPLSKGVEGGWGSLTLEGDGVRGLARWTVVGLSEARGAGDAMAGRGAAGRGRSPAIIVGPDVMGTYMAGVAEAAGRGW